MKLDLLDIVGSVIGPVLAVILLVGVVRVRFFLKFNYSIYKRKLKFVLSQTEKPWLPPHFSVYRHVFTGHIRSRHIFRLLCSSLDKYDKIFNHRYV